MRLKWDQVGEKFYETGVEMGVIFPMGNDGEYGAGEAWNGLTNVTESPSGAEATALYANNKKYGELYSTETLGGTIEAYTYPDTFAQCNGEAKLANGVMVAQQTRKLFGLVYKTLIGNDTENIKHGYKINIIYGCRVSPSEKANATINESTEAGTMSWEFTTNPISIPGFDDSSKITIDSRTATKEQLKALEDMVYGVDADTENSVEASEPKMPLPSDLITIFGVTISG